MIMGEALETTSKARLHTKQVMSSIWWDWYGVVFYERLPRDRTIHLDVYCDQMDKLNAEIHQNHSACAANSKGIVFHYDNARPKFIQ